MKPMTKERLEALREKCTSDYLTFLEGNEIMDEIQRLRGALEEIVGELDHETMCMGYRGGTCSCHVRRMEKIITKALSPSDETEVTK